MKVLVSPGHSQFSNAGVIKGYYEGTQMWKLGKFLQAELERYGIKVTNTRPNITDNPQLELRGQMAAGHDFAIFLHSNAPGSSNPGASGVTMYDSFEKPNEELADKLGRAIADAMKTGYNGVRRRQNDRSDRRGQDWYGELRNAINVAKCPSAMMPEHGYHTDPVECAKLMQDEVLIAIAKAEARVIAEHYGLIGSEDIMLKTGDKNELVGKWQRSLIQAGYPMTSIDGSITYKDDNSFGGATRRATEAFQLDEGLPSTGVVDSVTLLHMNDFLAGLVADSDEMERELRGEIVLTKTLLAESQGKIERAKTALN